MHSIRKSSRPSWVVPALLVATGLLVTGSATAQPPNLPDPGSAKALADARDLAQKSLPKAGDLGEGWMMSWQLPEGVPAGTKQLI